MSIIDKWKIFGRGSGKSDIIFQIYLQDMINYCIELSLYNDIKCDFVESKELRGSVAIWDFVYLHYPKRN